MSMQPVIYDIFRWMVGFTIVSTVYLIAAHWLVRSWRKRRAKQQPVVADGEPRK
jgi:hypothetical protein